MESLSKFIVWSNTNSGFLGFLIFIITLGLGWFSGIFKALQRRPSLKIEVLEGPTFCASFDTGRTYNNHLTHRTAIALYLSITNVGSAPTDIKDIHIGYKPCSFKNPFRWFWLKEITVAKSDFMVSLGEDKKVYPFLKQRNQSMDNHVDTYIREGQHCNGVVYFEQEESWGGCLPKLKNNVMDIKIIIYDAYNKKHSLVTKINKVTLDAAKKICDKFGETRESLL